MLKTIRSPKLDSKYSIGIDLGGTKVAAALVDSNGKILRETRIPTVPPWLRSQDPKHPKAHPSPTEVREHVKYVVSALTASVMDVAEPLLVGSRAKTPANLVGIGLASAGPMNIDEGILEYPSNFSGWKVVPIVRMLNETLQKRGLRTEVYFQNDAVAAALGEGWVGRARECKTYIMVTVGTGIGSGVILNGQPAQSRGMGSEWGHMIAMAPGIGKHPLSFNERSVEYLASGTGIFKRARARGFTGETAGDLARSRKATDIKLARELFGEAAEGLAALFFSLSLGFHPEKIVVSGGMLAVRDHFLPQATALYREMMKAKNRAFLCPVQVAKLGTKAGVIGAARLPYLNKN